MPVDHLRHLGKSQEPLDEHVHPPTGFIGLFPARARERFGLRGPRAVRSGRSRLWATQRRAAEFYSPALLSHARSPVASMTKQGPAGQWIAVRHTGVTPASWGMCGSAARRQHKRRGVVGYSAGAFAF
jgi:hypothetical protein